jgi:hypothetical protein
LDRRLARSCSAARRYWAWVCIRYAPRITPAWGRLASRPQVVSPADLAPRCLRLGLPDPTARIPALLAAVIGAAAEGGPVRRPSASWWQPGEGAHCLLLAPNLRRGTAYVACRVCASACPWRLPADPTGTPRQPNRPITPRKRQVRVGGGLLAVLTAILGRGSAVVVGGYQDVVA